MGSRLLGHAPAAVKGSLELKLADKCHRTATTPQLFNSGVHYFEQSRALSADRREEFNSVARGNKDTDTAP